MVSLRKTNFVGEVSYKDKSDGKVIGKARIEKTRSGGEVHHIDMTGKTADILLRGFKFADETEKEL